ncbi:MAG: hypothetical protein P8P74_05095 [Crocinitomicaceae bacterium]|nr:hypothetical protein [Crocinitomicaceae bacterium]
MNKIIHLCRNFKLIDVTYIENPEELVKEAVMIKVEKKCEHSTSNSMQKVTPGAGKTKKFVNEFFASNGLELNEDQWQSSREVVLSECPSTTLHSLTLEAERLGKTVTYSRSLTIKISD